MSDNHVNIMFTLLLKWYFLLMLTIKKLFFLFRFLVTISFSFSVFSSLASENSLAEQEHQIRLVERLLQQNPESLPYDKVINLSNSIIPQRNKYSNEVIAQVYLLLANITLNKGEIGAAFQFTQDGLAIASSNQKTQLRLQIKLAEILTAKKQYQKLLIVTEQAIVSSASKDNVKYLLFSLSYRSVAFAMLSHHKKALKDLLRVHHIIDQNPAFSEHISLLSILAQAYYHLGEYQTVLTIQLKILKLRFNLNELNNVSQTYYQLGNAYFNLHRYNDAYNAYWEAKQYAEKKDSPIYAAYAGQGLALTLQYQQNYSQAKIELQQAKKIFHQQHLTTPYLETLITLSQISRKTNQLADSELYLIEAEKLSKNVTLNERYITFYQILAQKYSDKDEFNNAYFWQKKYSQALLKNNPAHQGVSSLTMQKASFTDSSKTRQLTLKLAEQSELTSTYTNKYQQQQIVIFILSFFIASILFITLVIWLRRKAIHSKKAYDEQDKTNHVLASPNQTKQLYQTNFNMARKYSYPLTIGYISISNWQELTFKFNKKVVNEVGVGIANVIGEHIKEFESAGLINDGEYLLLFPHQSQEEASRTMEKILQALQLRFFAYLGEFSATLAYSVERPNFQDVDPYIFLSQLSTAVKSYKECT